MEAHADRLHPGHQYGVVAAIAIAVALFAFTGVSAILEATGIDVPIVNWPF
jgi:hypothetical protein